MEDDDLDWKEIHKEYYELYKYYLASDVDRETALENVIKEFRDEFPELQESYEDQDIEEWLNDYEE